MYNKLKNIKKISNHYTFSFSDKIFNKKNKSLLLQSIGKHKSKLIPLTITFTIAYTYYRVNDIEGAFASWYFSPFIEFFNGCRNGDRLVELKILQFNSPSNILAASQEFLVNKSIEKSAIPVVTVLNSSISSGPALIVERVISTIIVFLYSKRIPFKLGNKWILS